MRHNLCSRQNRCRKTGTVKGRVTGSGDDRPIAGITVRLAGDTLAGTSNGNGCS